MATPTNDTTAAPSFLQRILANDGTVADVPAGVLQAYLALNRSNAESLLAAQRLREDPPDLRRQALRQIATNFPNHPHVLFTAVTLDVFPEERRLWIDRFKSAAPDNALPLYLSARAYLKDGDEPRAFQELQAAVQQPNLNDYFAERAQAVEEIYLQQGRSPAEAKAVATMSNILPHLSLLKELGNDLAALQVQYTASADPDSVETIAQWGLHLSRQLSFGSGADCLVSQKIGLAIERTTVETLDPQHRYDWLGSIPAERLAQIEAELSSIEQARERSDRWLSQARDADLVAYFDRVKFYGEPAALRWLDQRSGESPPQP
jgi:tetratricopeptide (TPR) repeat protein